MPGLQVQQLHQQAQSHPAGTAHRLYTAASDASAQQPRVGTETLLCEMCQNSQLGIHCFVLYAVVLQARSTGATPRISCCWLVPSR